MVKSCLQSRKQRYKCKQCRRLFVEAGRPSYLAEFKEQAVAMYLEGLGFRTIGRLLGVSNVAVLKWIRQAAKALPEPKATAVVDIFEMDELWHFIKKEPKILDLDCC